ncbi:MAG: alpha/beta fold hydrolase [bacterium]|nr:alpha/beta fold hydrolase [bacterium]
MQETHPVVGEAVLDDGAALRYRDWRPDNPRGTIVCAHGIRSHGAWYLESCARLCGRGWRVLFPDRRGSGLNRDRADGLERWERWRRDLEQFVALAEAELPGKPVHLLGISWGARLVAVIAAGGAPVRGAVFSTPGLVSLAGYTAWRKVAVAAALLAGGRRMFAIPLEDPAMFTDDPDERNYIEEDAFGLRTVTARFLYESRELERRARAAFRRIPVPVLLLLAGRDRIIDNEGVRALFAACASPDKVLKVYERARHTLEFDACREEYIEDLGNWFDARA